MLSGQYDCSASLSCSNAAPALLFRLIRFSGSGRVCALALLVQIANMKAARNKVVFMSNSLKITRFAVAVPSCVWEIKTQL